MPNTTSAAAGQDYDRIIFDSDKVTAEWVSNVTELLLASTEGGIEAVQEVLPHKTAQQILEALYDHLKKDPTVVDVAPAAPDTPVFVVGDTHGQLHDVCSMLRKVGEPSEQRHFVFNGTDSDVGDFVDRGAWGLEVLVVLACWKLAFPAQVVILRGNHECTTCTHMYGFRGEVLAKYGPKHFKDVFKVCKKLFAALPLAAVVGGQTLILHGGLFRKPYQSTSRRKKRRKTSTGYVLEIGSLQDLRAASKGGLDPNGTGKSVIATDVLWSDPMATPGLVENEARGVGLLFGPDVTQGFLETNKLKLIIRSHEGPDARWKREGMQDMAKGHSLDHATPAGNLMTVFSAPDYPQFQPTNEDRFNNLGAVAILRGNHDDYTVPEMVEYSAAPRPQAKAFYMYEDVPDSDEEMSIGHGSPSDISAAGSQAGSDASHASSAGVESAEVLSRPSPQDAAEEGLPSRDTATATLSHQAGSGDCEAANGWSEHNQSNSDGFAAASHNDSTHTPSMQSHASTDLPDFVQPPEADLSPGVLGHAGDSRQDVKAAELDEHATTSAVNGNQQDPVSQTRLEAAADSHHSVDGFAHQSDKPLAPNHAPKKLGSQTDMLPEATHKRKAATVFDQGIAEEAEAADIDDGIVATAADDMNAIASQQPSDGSILGVAAEYPSDSTMPMRQSRKSQPKTAPWR